MSNIYSPSNMTSNNTPIPFEVTASSNIPNAYKAFNSISNEYWEPATNSTNEYIDVNLKIDYRANLFQLKVDTLSPAPTAISIYGSNSYPTFTLIQSFTGLTFTSGSFTNLVISSPVAYSSYRIELDTQGASPCRIEQIIIRRNDIVNVSLIGILAATIKGIISIFDTLYPDLLMDRDAQTLNNFSLLDFSLAKDNKRPITGQIFPRGFPVENSTIQFNPAVAPNLTNYNQGANGFIITEINGINTTPSNNQINVACDTSYTPPGSFCNVDLVDNQEIFLKSTSAGGATWSANSGNGIGVLVVDLGDVYDINTIVVFQKFSSGKVTQFTPFYHPTTTAIPPISTDNGWVSLTPETFIAAGTTGINGQFSNNGILTNPTTLNFTTTSTRYLKFHCRNDGSHDGGGWIELGGVKTFKN